MDIAERIRLLAEKANKNLQKKAAKKKVEKPAPAPKVVRRKWQNFSVWTLGHHIDYIEEYTPAAALKNARAMYSKPETVYITDDAGNYYPPEFAGKFDKPVPLLQKWMAYNHNGSPLMNEPVDTRDEAQKEANAYSSATGNGSSVSSVIVEG